MTEDLHELSLAELAAGLAAGDWCSADLVQHCHRRIEALDGRINSIVVRDPERALAAAAAADARRAAAKKDGGDLHPLCGIPLAHKDIFCTEGLATSCCSKILQGFVPPYDAHMVARMADAGMVCIGKANMDEFAMGSSTETGCHGATRNPWEPGCTAGGSSGGSAAAVAARLVPAASGSDTGGSIRQPAALCGITGVKPTYGRISRYGMIAFASSLDQAGPMARSAEDCALLLQLMCGHDPRDSTSVARPPDDYSAHLQSPVKGLRIGVPREYFAAGLHAESEAAVRAALAELQRQGAVLRDISLPNVHLSVPVYYVIVPAEASANLARFDGVRYGHRCADAKSLDELYSRTRGEGFGDEVKRRVLVGCYVLSAGYYEDYYRKAQSVRRLVKQDFVDNFQEVDIIAGPASPSPAFAFGTKRSGDLSMYLEDTYTIAANLAGLPAMALPCGLSAAGLPIGLQFIADYFDEARMLGLAHQYQQATDWHLRAPAMAAEA